MYKKHFYTTIVLLSFLLIGIQPAYATIYLTPTGWEDESGVQLDPEVYLWDQDSLTATLTTDVTETITISNPWFAGIGENDRITLIGGENATISGVGGQTAAVELNELNVTTGYVTIQNLTITDCDTGINLLDSAAINVTNNSVTNCQNGIRLIGARTCTIEGNIVSGGVISSNGIVLGRHISADRDSIDNDLYNNTIKDNVNGNGISISQIPSTAIPNTIFNNNFINNATNAIVSASHSAANVFYLDGSGNYWDDYTGEDADGDGIGDTPYTFTGGQDDYPWVVKNGWIEPVVLIGQLVATVEEMNLQQGINNGLDAKLDAALNALDDINQNNNVAAINSLKAFINAVEIQRDNGRITIAQAKILIEDATDIITLLGG